MRERDEKGRFKARDVAAEPAEAKPAKAKPKAKAKLTKKEREAIYFRELSTYCNVSAALRAAGMLSQSRTIYGRRQTDAAFRARWDAAIEQSYAMLELEMLERARFGDERPVPETAVEKRLRQVPTALGLQLLKLHQGRAKARATGPLPAPVRARMSRSRAREIRAEVEALLSDFNRRMGGEG